MTTPNPLIRYDDLPCLTSFSYRAVHLALLCILNCPHEQSLTRNSSALGRSAIKVYSEREAQTRAFHLCVLWAKIRPQVEVTITFTSGDTRDAPGGRRDTSEARRGTRQKTHFDIDSTVDICVDPVFFSP